MGFSLITAHSGCEQTPRDSMDSIERAVELKADIVEMDVRIGSNGTLKISHDPIMAEEEDEKLHLGAVFKRLLSTGMALNCDLKEAAALYGVLDMAASYGFGSERLVLSGCVSPEQLARDDAIVRRAGVLLNVEELLKILYLERLFRKGEEKRFIELMNTPWDFVKCQPLSDRELHFIITLVKKLGALGVNMPYQMAVPPVTEALQAEGIPLSLWTVNNAAEIKRCLRAGVANITTLTVASAVECRRQISKLAHGEAPAR